APPGLKKGGGIGVQGLAPLANDCRPSGAEKAPFPAAIYPSAFYQTRSNTQRRLDRGGAGPVEPERAQRDGRGLPEEQLLHYQARARRQLDAGPEVPRGEEEVLVTRHGPEVWQAVGAARPQPRPAALQVSAGESRDQAAG